MSCFMYISAFYVVYIKGVGRGGFWSRVTPPWLANFLVLTIQMPENLGLDPALEIQKSPIRPPLENILATSLVYIFAWNRNMYKMV